MKTEYVPRVNQLDSIALDKDIGRILRDQLTTALQQVAPGLLTRFQPELDLILRTAIWNYSVRTQLATFGQQLLFICYNPDQLTRSRLSLHFVTTVLLEYLRDVSTYRASHVEWLQRTTSWADSAIGVGHFVNIFRFLSTGKKPNLVDWILRLDHISMHGNRRRDVGYTNMTRELIWGGFMELLGFTLPLINYHSVKRRLRNIINFTKITKQEELTDNAPIITLATKCAYCTERPTLPHHMGCSHVFCYYCLKGNVMADENFQCPLCDWKGQTVQRV